MKLKLCGFTALPVADILPGGSGVETFAYVAGGVLVVLAVLTCVLILKSKIAPKLSWGKLQLEFVPLPNAKNETSEASTPEEVAAKSPVRPEQDSNLRPTP